MAVAEAKGADIQDKMRKELLQPRGHRWTNRPSWPGLPEFCWLPWSCPQNAWHGETSQTWVLSLWRLLPALLCKPYRVICPVLEDCYFWAIFNIMFCPCTSLYVLSFLCSSADVNKIQCHSWRHWWRMLGSLLEGRRWNPGHGQTGGQTSAKVRIRFCRPYSWPQGFLGVRLYSSVSSPASTSARARRSTFQLWGACSCVAW